jgi:hypothetical protein
MESTDSASPRPSESTPIALLPIPLFSTHCGSSSERDWEWRECIRFRRLASRPSIGVILSRFSITLKTWGNLGNLGINWQPIYESTKGSRPHFKSAVWGIIVDPVVFNALWQQRAAAAERAAAAADALWQQRPCGCHMHCGSSAAAPPLRQTHCGSSGPVAATCTVAAAGCCRSPSFIAG